MFAAAPVRADGSEQPEYRDAIERALQEFNAGRYPEAGALFARAHALFPNARTSFGLGVVAFEDRDYANTIMHLDSALADTRKPLERGQRQKAEQVSKQAWDFVARYRVTLSPPTAALHVDGKPAQTARGEVLLNPGAHELVVEAPGHQRAARRVSVKSGEHAEINFALEADRPAEVATPSEAAAPDVFGTARPPESAPAPTRPRWVAYTLLGVGGAALVGALVTGLVSNGAYSELEDKCGDDHLCPSGYDWTSARDRGQSMALVSDVLTISGVVFAGTGAVLWYLWRDTPTESAPRASFICTQHGCSAQARLSF